MDSRRHIFDVTCVFTGRCHQARAVVREYAFETVMGNDQHTVAEGLNIPLVAGQVTTGRVAYALILRGEPRLLKE